MNDEDFQLLCKMNRKGELTGVAKLYFRLVAAERDSKGVRFSAEDVSELVMYDEAITRVLHTEMENYMDANEELVASITRLRSSDD